MLSQLVWIKTYADDVSARVAQQLLDANGIHSVIADDASPGAEVVLPFVSGIRLAVREEEAKTALLILEDGGGT